jgi:predicted ATPase/DNA-binding NarL/FixJ family response regulator
MAGQTFPQQATSFVGREEEMADISSRLADPACRLLTLVGPGGIGKTRLAVETAVRVASDFADGVRFVNLQTVETADFLAAIADALAITLSGQNGPQTRLLSYLQDKEMLLVLDNFEHLLSQATFLSQILSETACVNLLVTSRQALNLQHEWLYPLRGLPVPLDSATTDVMTNCGAVQLFRERVNKVRPKFSLNNELTAVSRICRLLEGSPLALELAASWAKSLACTAIADEIQHNLAFLTTNLQDVPPRHRSMQAVFDQTWQFLSAEERQTFRCLSVFRGGFERDAAQRVAGASLSILSALVDKSLIWCQPDGRYHLHEPLRQYAQHRLEEEPDTATHTHVHRLHSAYYNAFLHVQFDDIVGGQQRQAVANVASELENVRTAWRWAADHNDVALLHKAADTLYNFYQFQSRYLEGVTTLERAIQGFRQNESSPQSEKVLVRLLVAAAWFYIRLGHLEKAEAGLAHAQAIYDRLQIPPLPGLATDPLLPLGIMALIQGNYEKAARLGEASRQINKTHDHQGNLKTAYYLLARAAYVQGEYEAAQWQAQKAYTTARAAGNRWFSAYCLNELGNIAAVLGDYPTAIGHYWGSYAIREEFDDAEGMAVALIHLGRVALQQQNAARAHWLFTRSLAIYRELNDSGGLATALHGLAQAALIQGNDQEAHQQLQQSLQIAANIQFVPLILAVIVTAGELLLPIRPPADIVAWLVFVGQQQATDYQVKIRAEQMLEQQRIQLTAEQMENAVRDGQAHTLTSLIQTVQAGLAIGKRTMTAPNAPENEPVHPPASQSLIEPLTEREEEILHLLAQGLTNKEIANQLTIVIGTVKTHNHNIYGKLGVDNRLQAVTRARELNLL